MSRSSSLLAVFGPSTLLALAACGAVPAPDSTALETADTATVAALETGADSGSSDLVISGSDSRQAVVLGTGPDLDADGYATSLDCDDADATAFPGAAEADDLADDDCDGWVDEDFVAVGDVVVSEVNRGARFGGSIIVNDGSWVEVYNASGRTIDLANWAFSRGASAPYNEITLDAASAPLLAPGDYAVLCDTDNYQGSSVAFPLTCDYVWGDEAQPSSYVGVNHDNTLYLRRDAETVALYLGGGRTTGTLIDSVHWTYDATNGYWPRDASYSLSLDAGYLNSVDNDNRDVWCSTSSSATGVVSASSAWRWYDNLSSTRDEHGTPGAANYACQNLPDLDADGYTGVDDCDDDDPSIHPGVAEDCDGIDQDCDGDIDNGAPGSSDWYADLDGDTFGDPGGLLSTCATPAGYVLDNTDCDDSSAAALPGGTEVCDDLDNDCNGSVDDGGLSGSNVFYADADGDSYGDPDSTTTSCLVPAGYSVDDADCDDSDATISPDGVEADDSFDNDCDGWVDEDFVAVGDLVFTEINRQARFGGAVVVNDGAWLEVYNDSARTVDLSNWTLARGTSTSGQQIALDPASAPVLAPGEYAVFCDTDNYQGSATAAWPMACDYVWGDETQAASYQGAYHNNVFYLRRDTDTVGLYVAGNRTTGTKVDSVTWTYDATNGYWPRNAGFSISLDAAYVDDTLNDQRTAWCSTASSATGTVTNNTAWRWFDNLTTANDEHGTPGSANYDCLNDPDLDGDGVTGATDCNEADATIYPGAPETCNDIDDDCDSVIDEDAIDEPLWYADADGDEFGDPLVVDLACDQPAAYVADATDCDDATASTNPGADEVCNDIDDDCDVAIDESAIDAPTWYNDLDGDTYGADADTSVTCDQPTGYLADGGDCDDADPAINPAATETCDGVDEDCDATIDDGAPGADTFYADADGDTYGDAATTTLSCVAPSGFVADATDCDDAASTTNPGAAEVCDDYVDNDCDPDPTSCEWSGSRGVKDEYDFRGYGTAASFSVGHSIANNGDFNGDGLDDVVVGQAYHDTTVVDAGRFHMWYGTVDASDALSTADLTVDGDSTVGSDQFGWASRFAGDVDGDGIDDLLSSAWLAGTTNGGKAYLFLGGTTPATVASAFASFGSTGTNNFTGTAVDGGDIDGDGLADVLTSAYGRASSAGAVGVWNSSAIGGGAEIISTDATLFITGATAGDYLGYSAAMAPDLDGDGMADLILGAPAAGTTTTPGKAYVFYGVDTLTGTISASTADATLTGSVNGDRFGLSVASLGDIDNDGAGDFAVSADKEDTSATDAGAVYLYTSTPTGAATGASAASSMITGEVANDFFGRSVGGVGDTNGDGYDDLSVGATGYDVGSLSGAGAMYVVYGPVVAGTSSATTYGARFVGANTSDAVGYAVGGGGDVDGDGYADFMTSAPSWDSFGFLNAGGSWLFYGRGE
ncbi:MAG: MopE-related protein [Pseudomonadota bacterium]|nr:MopE-related protein [Pseudomonadota bacterium]